MACEQTLLHLTFRGFNTLILVGSARETTTLGFPNAPVLEGDLCFFFIVLPVVEIATETVYAACFV